MRDDDLHGPTLSPPPSTSPIARGAAAVVITVALATAGCHNDNPGVPPDATTPGVRLVDAGLSAPPDAGADALTAPGVGLRDAGP